jgi:hypothetical protein|tara:strand:+ start:59 stop:472 length:414 start_codon:yes stop_codon:yes gene_type:complete
MNTLNLIYNFLNEQEDKFKENLSAILENKINERKKNIKFETVSDIFEEKKSLNISKPKYDVINVLSECAKQNSNIMLTLVDGSETVLKPTESRQVLATFDNLNEKNQIRLINRLVESTANFHNTMEFCINFKGRYTR